MNTTLETEYDLHPIECAILDLEAARESRYMDKWNASEMKELKKACCGKNSPAIGYDIYRAMVAENNGWTHRGGWADINQVEQFMREWENYKLNQN